MFTYKSKQGIKCLRSSPGRSLEASLSGQESISPCLILHRTLNRVFEQFALIQPESGWKIIFTTLTLLYMQ